MQNVPTLGERLAAFRVARGLSLSEAADAIGHSTDFLGHIESGHELPSDTVIAQLAALYGFDPKVVHGVRPC